MASGGATGAGPYAPRVVQDMPPPGGFAPYRTTAYFPKRGPSGPVILLSWLGITAWGLYKVGETNHELDEYARERKEAQRNLLPLLQAESDRQYIRERKVKIMIEKEVMKEFPDWQPGENVYRTIDWMPPMPAPEDLFFRGPDRIGQ